MMVRLLVLLCLLFTTPALSAQVGVKGVRTWASPENTRIVFDLTEPVKYSVFTLANPDRVVVDLSSTRPNQSVVSEAPVRGVIRRVRSAPRNGSDYRIVFDVTDEVEVDSFMVAPNKTYGHRLVLDLKARNQRPPEPVRKLPPAESRHELVIAVDAGHGGEDPGAIGAAGTYEKDVVLEVAKELARLIEREPGMRPLMIRTGDYYVGLRDRTKRAREQQADMFISLHADANPQRNVAGASVYTLSERGASTEAARLLAVRENTSDHIGGVSLDGKDDLVATVLLDLSRVATIESSHKLASTVLNRLGSVGPVHRRGIEQAGFAVLKSLDMPSILIELAFITNPKEERRLRSKQQQRNYAAAIMDGIRDYAKAAGLPELRTAQDRAREHVVREGETLSSIAREYEVTLGRLRSANNLAGDQILVGSKLLIP